MVRITFLVFSFTFCLPNSTHPTGPSSIGDQRHPLSLSLGMCRFNVTKGFGFITPDGGEKLAVEFFLPIKMKCLH
jgi:hypothetical protein